MSPEDHHATVQLPSKEQLEQLEKAVPGATERILQLIEAEAKSRQDERVADGRATTRAFRLLVGCVGIAFFGAVRGWPSVLVGLFLSPPLIGAIGAIGVFARKSSAEGDLCRVNLPSRE